METDFPNICNSIECNVTGEESFPSLFRGVLGNKSNGCDLGVAYCKITYHVNHFFPDGVRQGGLDTSLLPSLGRGAPSAWLMGHAS